MQKLLTAYRANPTRANAEKLRAYNRKHPMAVCMLSIEDHAVLNEANQYFAE